MIVNNEFIGKTDFDLIQKYMKNRKWNRDNPTQKRIIPTKQQAAYIKHINIADDLLDMDYKG